MPLRREITLTARKKHYSWGFLSLCWNCVHFNYNFEWVYGAVMRHKRTGIWKKAVSTDKILGLIRIFVMYVSVTESQSRIYYGNWFEVRNKYFCGGESLIYYCLISERFGEGASSSTSIISKLSFAQIIIVFLICFVFLKCNERRCKK